MPAKMYSTIEECLAAVQKDGWALEFVPETMKTLEVCLSAIQNSGYVLRYVPETMKTPILCLAAVQQNTFAFYSVPEEMRTYEICMAAVRNYGRWLEYVPEELQTPDIIAAAIADRPDAAQYIKKNTIIKHDEPKEMPKDAYDTLMLVHDEDTTIRDGELMVDFHNEFMYGRFYRKQTFDELILKSKRNPTTREKISEYTIYQAKL